MKIAIPSDEGTYLSQHFGRSAGFVIFEVAEGKIVGQDYRTNDFTGHVLGQHHQHHGNGQEDHPHHSHNRILHALEDCEVVIAGGMGRRLLDDLTEAGIRIYISTEPEVRKAIDLFLEDKLISDKSSCGHHE